MDIGQELDKCFHFTGSFHTLVIYGMNSLLGTVKFRGSDELNGILTSELPQAVCCSTKRTWRWRYQLLSKPRQRKPSELHGIIEADETFINESFKGKRTMPRPYRKRGNKSNDIVKVPVLLDLDRNGAVTHRVLARNTREELEGSLAPVLTPESVLCTDGNVSYQTIVKNLPFELDHKRLIAFDNQRVIDGIYHIQTLNNWMMRWKQWLRQFNGVGTAYLDNYLAWFRQMEQSKDDDSWMYMRYKTPYFPYRENGINTEMEQRRIHTLH